MVGVLTGTELKLVPARLESFAEFKTRHPDGQLLIPNDPKKRDYGRNPYVGYDTSAAPLLYRGDFPKGMEPMARVVVVLTASGKKAVALELLRKKGQLTLGEVELAWRAGQASALEHSEVSKGRDVGTVTAFVRQSDGRSRDVPYDVTFAFVVFAFHPNIPIIKE